MDPACFPTSMESMNWNPEYRYKILGKLIRTKTDMLFVFDLNCAETYRCREGEKENHSRSPIYPDSWKNQFGVPVNEHQDMLQVSIFDDHAVFRISKEEEGYKKGPVPSIYIYIYRNKIRSMVVNAESTFQSFLLFSEKQMQVV